MIVGIGLSDYPKAPHLTAVQHHVQALQRALADSGVAKSAIDGYCTAGGMASGDVLELLDRLEMGHASKLLRVKGILGIAEEPEHPVVRALRPAA